MPKYVVVPAPIQLVQPLTGEKDGDPISLRMFVTKTVMGDARWVSDFRHIESAHDIMEVIKKAPDGPVWAFDKDDYEKLKSFAERPQGQGYAIFHGSMVGQFRDFINALIKAEDKDPSAAPEAVPPKA